MVAGRIAALHGVVGFAAIAAGRRLGQRALVIGAVAPAATLVSRAPTGHRATHPYDAGEDLADDGGA